MNLAEAAGTPAPGRAAGRKQTVAVLLVAIVAIVVLALALGGGFGANDGLAPISVAGDPGTPVIGAVPPNFTATTYDGKTVSLAQYAGKPVWLTFGASWCPDCRTEAPDVEAAYLKYQPQGLNILAVFKQETAADVQSYATRAGLTFPIAVDEPAQIAGLYRTMGIPTHFFIGADGRIKDIKLGALDPATIDREIQAILAR
jgi:cytochrome c biogenesis protein CcmG/thiol:disulfide interchange protein DsbE